MRREARLRSDHHRDRRRRRHGAARDGGDGCSHPGRRERPAGAARGSELDSGSGLEGPPLPHQETGWTSRATPSRRTCTTASAATRNSGAACCSACGARTSAKWNTPGACRRRGHRLLHARAVRRSRRSLYPSAARLAEDPTEPARGPFPYPAVPHAAGMQKLVDRMRPIGLHPSSLPLGLIDPALPAADPLRYLQLVPVQDAREERCGRLLRPAGAGAATSRCGRERSHARLLTDAAGDASSPSSRA